MYFFLKKIGLSLIGQPFLFFYYGHSIADWKVVYQEKYATKER